jgi:hypothetical protein
MFDSADVITPTEQDVNNQKKSVEIRKSLKDSINILTASEIIKETSNLPQRYLDEIIQIFSLRNEYGGEPDSMMIKTYLWDLPALTIALQTQFLAVKNYREHIEDELEKKEYLLRVKAEESIKVDRKNEIEQKERKDMGAITNDQIKAKMFMLFGYKEIDTLRNELRLIVYKEKVLEKTVDIMDKRSYSLNAIAKIDMGME